MKLFTESFCFIFMAKERNMKELYCPSQKRDNNNITISKSFAVSILNSHQFSWSCHPNITFERVYENEQQMVPLLLIISTNLLIKIDTFLFLVERQVQRGPIQTVVWPYMEYLIHFVTFYVCCVVKCFSWTLFWIHVC